MHRRQLLKLAAATPLAAVTSRVWAAPTRGGPRILVVFLRGAYDAANVVIRFPATSTTSRAPPCRSPGPMRAIPTPPLPLDAEFGLHRR